MAKELGDRLAWIWVRLDELLSECAKAKEELEGLESRLAVLQKDVYGFIQRVVRDEEGGRK